MPPRVCLVTAATECFVPGTMVTVGSFLGHHPDYDGDVVVIEDGLPGKRRGRLRALFDRVRFLPVSSRRPGVAAIARTGRRPSTSA